MEKEQSNQGQDPAINPNSELGNAGSSPVHPAKHSKPSCPLTSAAPRRHQARGRRFGESDQHRLGVGHIVEKYGLETKRFNERLRESFPEIVDEDGDHYLRPYVPDAFEIHLEEREVIIHEVEWTSRLTNEKLDGYADLWFDLDCDEIGLGLVRWPATSAEFCEVISLQDRWYANLEADASAVNDEQAEEWRRLFADFAKQTGGGP